MRERERERERERVSVSDLASEVGGVFAQPTDEPLCCVLK